MSLFTRLVERAVLSQTKDDILINKLIIDWPNINLAKQDPRGAKGDPLIYDCTVFYDIMV